MRGSIKNKQMFNKSSVKRLTHRNKSRINNKVVIKRLSLHKKSGGKPRQLRSTPAIPIPWNITLDLSAYDDEDNSYGYVEFYVPYGRNTSYGQFLNIIEDVLPHPILTQYQLHGDADERNWWVSSDPNSENYPYADDDDEDYQVEDEYLESLGFRNNSLIYLFTKSCYCNCIRFFEGDGECDCNYDDCDCNDECEDDEDYEDDDDADEDDDEDDEDDEEEDDNFEECHLENCDCNLNDYWDGRCPCDCHNGTKFWRMPAQTSHP